MESGIETQAWPSRAFAAGEERLQATYECSIPSAVMDLRDWNALMFKGWYYISLCRTCNIIQNLKLPVQIKLASNSQGCTCPSGIKSLWHWRRNLYVCLELDWEILYIFIFVTMLMNNSWDCTHVANVLPKFVICPSLQLQHVLTKIKDWYWDVFCHRWGGARLWNPSLTRHSHRSMLTWPTWVC